jgi:hypothetical protein
MKKSDDMTPTYLSTVINLSLTLVGDNFGVMRSISLKLKSLGFIEQFLVQTQCKFQDI